MAAHSSEEEKVVKLQVDRTVVRCAVYWITSNTTYWFMTGCNSCIYQGGKIAKKTAQLKEHELIHIESPGG